MKQIRIKITNVSKRVMTRIKNQALRTTPRNLPTQNSRKIFPKKRMINGHKNKRTTNFIQENLTPIIRPSHKIVSTLTIIGSLSRNIRKRMNQVVSVASISLSLSPIRIILKKGNMVRLLVSITTTVI